MHVLLQSMYGTRVNHINYKDSRCILSEYDLIGFGCSPTAKRVKDKSDMKCYVYRVALGSMFNSSETIELSDGSDDEADSSNPFDASDGLDVGNETDDDCSSAEEDEEEDVKPDIHTLMREAMETMQIKQEVEGYCYDYEKAQWNQVEPTVENKIPICLDSEDEEKEDILLLEPPRKRVRQVEPEYSFPTHEREPEQKIEKDDSSSEQTLPEYQMSDTTLKEKVKLVTRSRGQQLATDMLKNAQKTLFKNGGPSQQEANTSSSVSQTYEPPSEYSNYSIADLSNAFISEITKWEYQWINNKNPNPLRYQMDVKPLDTNFINLTSFQRFV